MATLGNQVARGVGLARNAFKDLRYGEVLGLNVRPRDLLRKPDTHHRFVYHYNSDYAALAAVFDGQIRADDVLVDVGCGKGRVLNWWVAQGLPNQLIGLEHDEEIAARTGRRLRSFANVTVIAGDAIAKLPPAGTLYYLFNPFDRDTVQRFKDRLPQVATRPENLRLLYYSCKEVSLFEDDPAWHVERRPPSGPCTMETARISYRGPGRAP